VLKTKRLQFSTKPVQSVMTPLMKSAEVIIFHTIKTLVKYDIASRLKTHLLLVLSVPTIKQRFNSTFSINIMLQLFGKSSTLKFMHVIFEKAVNNLISLTT